MSKFNSTFAVISGINPSGMNALILDPVEVSISRDGVFTVTGRSPLQMANLEAATRFIGLCQGAETTQK